MVRSKGCIPIQATVIEEVSELIPVVLDPFTSSVEPEFLEDHYNWVIAKNKPDAGEQKESIILTLNKIIDSCRAKGEHHKADTYEVVRLRLLDLPPMKKPRLFSKYWRSKRRYDIQANKPHKYVCYR